jgi:hypothetical protein
MNSCFLDMYEKPSPQLKLRGTALKTRLCNAQTSWLVFCNSLLHVKTNLKPAQWQHRVRVHPKPLVSTVHHAEEAGAGAIRFANNWTMNHSAAKLNQQETCGVGGPCLPGGTIPLTSQITPETVAWTLSGQVAVGHCDREAPLETVCVCCFSHSTRGLHCYTPEDADGALGESHLYQVGLIRARANIGLHSQGMSVCLIPKLDMRVDQRH